MKSIAVRAAVDVTVRIAAVTFALLGAANHVTRDGATGRADRAAKMVERFDTDGNGSLDASELEAMGDKHGGKRGGKEGGKHGHKGGDKGARMIERMDANDDGKLSMEEMMQRHDPAKMFERLDKDGNGSVSAEEFEAAKKMHGKRHNKGHKMHHDKPQQD